MAPLLLAASIIALCARPAMADDEEAPFARNLYGSPGLIDMPSARMAPDGSLAVGASYFQNIQRYNFSFQVLPWLETDFRYSGLQHFDPDYPVYYDRSFAVKLRFWDETDVLPALAVGVNDIVGTGIYAGEYLVASKHLGPVDATLGIGWGRMGSTALFRNPLSILSSKFDTRPNGYGPGTTAGQTNFNTLFRGRDSGLFGGLAWTTPVDGLTLQAEYSSDAYALEAARGSFIPRNQVNVGASYQLSEGIALSANWLYGRAVAGNLTFQLDPTHDPFTRRLGTPEPPVQVRTAQEQQHALSRMAGRPVMAVRASQARMVDALWAASFAIENVAVKGRSLQLTISGGDPKAVCAGAAKIAGREHFDVAQIVVSRGRASAYCPVMMDPVVTEANFSDEPAEQPHLILASERVSTIDAAVPERVTNARATAKIRADLVSQRLTIHTVSLSGSVATVYYANFHYRRERDAVDRIIRVLMQDAPPDIETFRLVAVLNGVPQRAFEVLRSPVERIYSQTGELDVFGEGGSNSAAPMRNPILSAATSKFYPSFDWSIFPQFRQQLFDPNNPFAVQLLAGLSVWAELAPGLSVQAEGELDIYDNFNTLRPSDSVLPHVRTDFVKYFSEGKNGIGNIEVDYRFRLSPNVFAVARAGILESMYDGVGGEVLWRPEGRRWALGFDAYEVKQRNFDRLFGLQSYHAFTGHVSLYYASPWFGLNFVTRAGQYLAGDRGITFEITRRFDSGVEIGAFMTRTNVSAETFGEGSFDKGIIIRIPLDWVMPTNTQSQFNLDLRPVQRDGGQRLLGDAILYEETRRASQVEMQGTNSLAD